jgi:hypothetical protein
MQLSHNYPEAGAYATAYKFCHPDGHIERPKYKYLPKHTWEGIIPKYFRTSLGDPPVCTSAVMVKRSVLIKVGGFPVGHKITEDLDAWARIAFNYPIAWSSKCESIYYVDVSSSARKTVRLDQDFILIKTLLMGMNQKNEYKKDISNLIGKYYLNCARYYMRSGDAANAARCLRGATKFSSGIHFFDVTVRRILFLLPEHAQDNIFRIKTLFNKYAYRQYHD